jgi:hypothetical protein
VIGHDQHSIRGRDGLLGQGDRAQLVLVLSHPWEHRHVRIVVRNLGAAILQQRDDLGGGGFAAVVDVGLVGQADDEDPRSLERLALIVERLGEAFRRRNAAFRG